MKSDIEIARSIELKKIKQVAESVGIPREEVENYGRYIAKIPEHLIDEEKVKQSNLILVTAITATKAGIGKTTVSIGLALGLNKIGKIARESHRSLARTLAGPVLRHERRSGRRRLRAGTSYGEDKLTFHRRFPCHHFRSQYDFRFAG